MAFRDHIPTILLVTATVLLFLTCLSTPIINNFGLAVARIKGQDAVVRFSVFGYCQTAGLHECTPRGLGYKVTQAITYLHDRNSSPLPKNLDSLTYGLVMHPIATALSTIAMIIAIFSNRIGFVFATVVAFIAFFCSMIAMAVDLSLFGQMKSKMNVYDELVASTKYGAATWVTVVATVLLLFATCASVFETCRRRRADRW